ncbi:MAG: serine hydrolase [Gammaproteobacteria bacterium]|nr:serine hydrolase [Gammaproteobacteria bacterium]
MINFFQLPYKICISKTLIALTVSLFLSACGSSSSDNSSLSTQHDAYSYQQPEIRNDGWTVSDASTLGINTSIVESVVQNIIDEQEDFRYIEALVIIKNGQLLLDERFKSTLDFTDDWSGNQDLNLHILNSVTKSFTSTLVGIAIDQQLIPDVDALVHDFFPEKFPIQNWDESKANITLKNWLTMRHGYLWDEWNITYLDPTNLNSQMNNAVDPVQFLLDRPMDTTPGTTFAYSTGVSYGIGKIVQQSSGMDIHQFMEQYLFTPLQITDYDYWALDGQIHTGSALYLSIRDMAKLGQLFLDKGLWNGTRVISEAWVDEATERYVDNVNWGYGYQWWMRRFQVNGQSLDCFYADGFGGQYIFVFPEINAIIAFHGDAYTDEEKEHRNVTRIMEDFLLPELL